MIFGWKPLPILQIVLLFPALAPGQAASWELEQAATVGWALFLQRELGLLTQPVAIPRIPASAFIPCQETFSTFCPSVCHRNILEPTGENTDGLWGV